MSAAEAAQQAAQQAAIAVHEQAGHGHGHGHGNGHGNGNGARAPPVGQWRPGSKKELLQYKSRMKATVPLKAYTVLAEDAIPPQPEVEKANRTTGTWLNFAPGPRTVELYDDEEEERASYVPPRQAGPPPERVLDGFVLLDASSAALPNQATRVSLSDQNFSGVVAEDLSFFNALTYVDLGDNRLRLEMLMPLQAMVELRLHCNGLRTIGDIAGGFPMLEVLDLSYNELEVDSVASLCQLPNLRELDVTCNALEAVPSNMADFKKLEVLILERNRLEADEDLVLLSRTPKLRELNVSFNYFKRVPDACTQDNGFRMLEWLSLANNYIASEQDILPLVRFPRLLQVILYGNPITELQSAAAPGANAALNEQEAEGKVVNLVTDAPAAQPQRKPTYSNFRMSKVTDRAVPSATTWRETGNRELFGDDPDADDVEEAAANALEDFKQRESRKKAAKDRQSRDVEKTTIFMTADDDGGLSVDSGSESDDEGLAVPASLLQQSLEAAGPEAGDPAKLRAAINALRHVLKHPLTSHVSKTSKPSVARPTKLQKLRQKPIKPYEGMRTGGKGGGGTVTGLNVSKHHIRGVGGDDSVLAQTRLRGEGPSGAGAGAGASSKGSLERMEKLLQTMDNKMVAVESELGAATHHDRSMNLLMNMVGKVMETYE